MTAYDETRCYGVVGTAQSGPMYCGSPAKRKDNNGRPLCGRCKDPQMTWFEDRSGYPYGTIGVWFFKRNAAPKPWALTVANVTRALDESSTAATRVRSGLRARKRYDGSIAVEWKNWGSHDSAGSPHCAALFAKARDALAARGLTLVMVDDRHATVTETKP